MKTTLYSILCAAARVAALLLVVESLLGIAGHFLNPIDGVPVLTNWIVIGGGLFGAAVGVVLWMYPGWLVRPAVGRAAHEVLESSLAADDIQRIGICLIGIWFAVDGIRSLVYLLIRSGVVASQGYDNPGITLAMSAPDIAAALALIVTGVSLTLGSRGLVGLLIRLRGRS
ncbi:hypothetical protein [Tahibacter caeni]|uniref:hypothetical protein n=1 Tax=Tahibacter caeni TaxID=1453545 RepID=UPI002147642E|nr:hypothetical protein [Tahibacter caeni]